MDFTGLVKSLSSVILQRGAFVEVDSHGELTSIHLDDGRRRPKQPLVFCEVFNPQSSGHDQELHGHAFLQTDGGETEKLLQKQHFLFFL